MKLGLWIYVYNYSIQMIQAYIELPKSLAGNRAPTSHSYISVTEAVNRINK